MFGMFSRRSTNPGSAPHFSLDSEGKKILYVKMIAICFIVRLNQTIKLFWIGFHRAICLDVSSNWEPNQLFICRLSLGKADPKNEMPPMNCNHRFVPEFSRCAWQAGENLFPQPK